MNDKSIFNSLTFATRYLMKSSLDRINDEKRGINSLAANIEHLSSTLSWNAEDWMEASMLLQYANWSAKALELALLECREAVIADEAKFDGNQELEAQLAKMLDERAADIIRSIAQETFGVIVRGPTKQGGAMSNLEEAAKQSAARKAMEALCNIGSYNLTNGEAIVDVMEGKARREGERREVTRKIPRSIRYFKKDRCDGGYYMAIAYNSDSERVDHRDFPEVTRKGDALTAVADWIKEIRARYPNQHITITTEAM